MNLPRLVLALLFALISSACTTGGTEQIAVSSTTTLISALDAWRDCVIQRVAEVNTGTDQQLAEIERRLDVAREQIETQSKDEARLRSAITAIEDTYEAGTAALNDAGLPGTVEQIREDPDIAAALDAGTAEAMSQLDAGEFQTLTSVLKREEDHEFQLIELQNQLRTVTETKQGAQREQQELEAELVALAAERDSTISALEAALSSTNLQEPDWSVCTGSR